MLETHYVDDKLKMFETGSTIDVKYVIKIKTLDSKVCHPHPKVSANFKSSTSL